MNDSDNTFVFEPNSSYDFNSTGTVTINTATWDDSFTTSPSSIYTTGGDGLQVTGSLKVDGVDVMQSIKDMQRVLGVVGRDLEKEEKYKGLKRAAKEYERELEQIETFEALKGSK